jgi:hypothetical protein
MAADLSYREAINALDVGVARGVCRAAWDDTDTPAWLGFGIRDVHETHHDLSYTLTVDAGERELQLYFYNEDDEPIHYTMTTEDWNATDWGVYPRPLDKASTPPADQRQRAERPKSGHVSFQVSIRADAPLALWRDRSPEAIVEYMRGAFIGRGSLLEDMRMRGLLENVTGMVVERIPTDELMAQGDGEPELRLLRAIMNDGDAADEAARVAGAWEGAHDALSNLAEAVGLRMQGREYLAPPDRWNVEQLAEATIALQHMILMFPLASEQEIHTDNRTRGVLKEHMANFGQAFAAAQAAPTAVDDLAAQRVALAALGNAVAMLARLHAPQP